MDDNLPNSENSIVVPPQPVTPPPASMPQPTPAPNIPNYSNNPNPSPDPVIRTHEEVAEHEARDSHGRFIKTAEDTPQAPTTIENHSNLPPVI